jgi:hypothetical protein
MSLASDVPSGTLTHEVYLWFRNPCRPAGPKSKCTAQTHASTGNLSTSDQQQASRNRLPRFGCAVHGVVVLVLHARRTNREVLTCR